MASEDLRSTRDRDLLALAAVVILYGLLASHLWFLSDDAFITFRYARNWVEGHGLRYNAGEEPPVEGYSNFLWVAVCAAIESLGMDPVLWAPLASLLSGALLLTLVYRALRRRLACGWQVSALATLSLGVFPPFAAWGTGGLETMPFALALFATFDSLVLREEPAPARAALAALCLSLLRIEGICWAILVGLIGFLSRMKDRRAIPSLAFYFLILAFGYGLYFGARYAYYQLLFPTSVYLKVSTGPDVLLRGYRYVAMFVLTFLTPFLVVPGAIASLIRGPLRSGAAIALMALAVPAYAVVVGGDWMIMGRFLIPGLAFQTLLLGSLLELVWTKGFRGRAGATVLALATIGVGLLPAWNVHAVPESVRSQYRFMYSHPGFRSEYEEWKATREGIAYQKEVGLALGSHARPGDSLVAGAIGAIGYYSNLNIYDRFGLVTREVAERVRSEAGSGPLRSPGHDVKVSRDFFLGKQPTYLLFDAIESRAMRSRVLEQAESWRGLGSLWRRYAPDFIILDGKSVAETGRVLIVFRAIEEETADLEDLERPERRRVRAERAEAVWQDFYARAALLPDGSAVE